MGKIENIENAEYRRQKFVMRNEYCVMRIVDSG